MVTREEMSSPQGTVNFKWPEEGSLLVQLKGTWKIGQDQPGINEVMDQAALKPGLRNLSFDHSGLEAWDSSLLTFLVSLMNRCSSADISVDLSGLPMGVVRLLELSSGTMDAEGLLDRKTGLPFLAGIGESTLKLAGYSLSVLEFLGEASMAILRFLAGKACYRRSDLWQLIYECGAQALPIVFLISALVGLILGFVGVVQLRIFGAQIYIANLVGIGMAREMGAMMTAIIMMGRTGAAFATQLGTMETNEEIDALKTLGISPMEFLVMPRMIALVLMMPLLCVYADIVGILGGAFVGVGMYDISINQYYEQTRLALKLNHLYIGIIKSAVFAVLIAISGCFHGMHVDRSASAVGYAATRAVVVGIVLIVITDGIFAVVTSIMKI